MNSIAKGYLSTITAFVLWGVLTLYWRAMGTVGSLEILAHRILWSFVLLVILYLRTKEPFAYLKDRRTRVVTLATSVLITINWGTYIFAVSSGHVVEASLGYYINPLVVVLLGAVFLKEKLQPIQWAAFILAVVGVANLTLRYGKLPWIALVLAFSFGFYGLLKKLGGLDSGKSLFTEVLFITPVALTYLAVTEVGGTGNFFSGDPLLVVLFLGSGAVTTLPLFLFAEGAKRIPLSAVGFMQYIAPTIMLAIGVFLLGESFSPTYQWSFGFIWAGLALYSASLVFGGKRRRVTVTSA